MTCNESKEEEEEEEVLPLYWHPSVQVLPLPRCRTKG